MEEFAKWIMDELEKLLGEEYWMKYMETKKGNGKIYHGILIAKETDDIGPLVYIDFYMKKYQEGSPGNRFCYSLSDQTASGTCFRLGKNPEPL